LEQPHLSKTDCGGKISAAGVILIKMDDSLIDLAAWWKKYGSMVIWRCKAILLNEEDAKDAAQEVFLKLLKVKERIYGIYPSSLLCTMATNECLNRLKAKKREMKYTDAYKPIAVQDSLFREVDSARSYESVIAKLDINMILDGESEMTRTILYMYYEDGLPLRDIAKNVGMSTAGVGKRLEVFRKQARLKLGKDYGWKQ